MQNDLFPIPERSTCPKCTCGYVRLSEEDPLGKKNPILQLSRTREKSDLLEQVHAIENVSDFERVRENVKRQYRITFLVSGDGSIQLDQIPGMCKRTQESFKRAMSNVLRSSHASHQGKDGDVLLQVLQKDDIFWSNGID